MKRQHRYTYAASFVCAGCRVCSPERPTDGQALDAATRAGWHVLKTTSWCPACQKAAIEAVARQQQAAPDARGAA